MLKGKCKIEFEKRYSFNVYSDTHHILGLDEFYNLPLFMQWGVYLEFFDSVGIYIELMILDVENTIEYFYDVDNNNCSENYKSRQQAQQKAIEQANEIFNGKTI